MPEVVAEPGRLRNGPRCPRPARSASRSENRLIETPGRRCGFAVAFERSDGLAPEPPNLGGWRGVLVRLTTHADQVLLCISHGGARGTRTPDPLRARGRPNLALQPRHRVLSGRARGEHPWFSPHGTPCMLARSSSPVRRQLRLRQGSPWEPDGCVCGRGWLPSLPSPLPSEVSDVQPPAPTAGATVLQTSHEVAPTCANAGSLLESGIHWA
jgi:hypothetical protein